MMPPWGKNAIPPALLAAGVGLVMAAVWQHNSEATIDEWECAEAGGETYTYYVWVPNRYGSSCRKWPVLVCLHGSGGGDVTPSRDGVSLALGRQAEKYSFLVAYPRSPGEVWDANARSGHRLFRILDQLTERYNVDEDRLYLTGVSMGAAGVWDLAAARPARWAAIAPVSGYGEPAEAARLAAIPCWCFHGKQDDVVGVEQSRIMTDAIARAGGSAMLTEYENGGHGVWRDVYARDDLFAWLLGNSKTGRPSFAGR